MAEIQTYPSGTPTAGDGVVYVEDPAGAAALKLADPTSFGGGAGGGPFTLHQFDGSSLTGVTAVAGTWGTGSEFTQSDTANAAHDLHLASAVDYSAAQCVLETEVKFGAAGYTGISTLLNGAFFTNSPCIALSENTLTMISAGSAVLSTTTIVAAVDTWHTLRVVATGTYWSVFLNATMIMGYTWGTYISANGLSLYSQNCVSHFRNVSLWTR